MEQLIGFEFNLIRGSRKIWIWTDSFEFVVNLLSSAKRKDEIHFSSIEGKMISQVSNLHVRNKP